MNLTNKDEYEAQFSKRRTSAGKRLSINAKKGTSEYEFVREIDDAPSNPKSGLTGVKSGQVTSIYIQPDDLLPGQIYNEINRPEWDGKFSNLKSMALFAVGLSNIYRFPHMCYIHGGMTFLIPYVIFLVFLVTPLLYLEVLVGQFVNSGMINVWKKLVPFLRGVGWCQCLLPVMLAFFNNAILTWALFYSAMSLTQVELPWIGCHHDWNTVHCRDVYPDFEKVDVNRTDLRAGAEYFRGSVQRRWKSVYMDKEEIKHKLDNGKNQTFGFGENDISSLGMPNGTLALYLTGVYVAMYIFMHRGLRHSGNSIWYMLMIGSPYLIMTLLIFRSASVPGAKRGLSLMFGMRSPELLWHWKTWVDAAEQAFFSVGVGGGVHITLASYNNFNANVLQDAIGTVLIDFGTSLLCCTIIFIAVGSLAEADNSQEVDLFAQGPDLIFEVCCDFWARFPGSDFFSFMFFLMVFLVGVQCSIVSLSCTKEALFESLGKFFDRNGRSRWALINLILALAYIVGFLCITRSGVHLFLLLDNYTAGTPYLICSLIMSIGFTWFWGMKELCNAAESMTGKRPNALLQILWKFVCPIVLIILLIPELFLHEEASYEDRGTKDVFRKSIQIFGRIYTHVPTILIPIGMIVHMFSSRGVTWRKKLLLGMSPNYTHDKILEVGTGVRATKAHYFYCLDRPKVLKKLSAVSKIHPEQSYSEDEAETSQPGFISDTSTDSLEERIMNSFRIQPKHENLFKNVNNF